MLRQLRGLKQALDAPGKSCEVPEREAERRRQAAEKASRKADGLRGELPHRRASAWNQALGRAKCGWACVTSAASGKWRRPGASRSGRRALSRRCRTWWTARAASRPADRAGGSRRAEAFGLTRRSALWQVERAGRPRGPLLRDADVAPDPSPLPEMTLSERLQTDIMGTTFTIGPHPMIVHREGLAARGIKRAWDLTRLREGTRLTVAGAVVCRQRPATAKGFLFLTLEDETGLANIIVRPDLFEAHAAVWSHTEALEIDGVLQKDGGLSVCATAVRPLQVPPLHTTSHDFH